MTAKVYRFYTNDNPQDRNYTFSIVASETNAEYVVPKESVNLRDTFNSRRIDDILVGLDENEIPDTPELWAALASLNVGRLALFPVEGLTGEETEDLVPDEQAYADATAEKYAYLKEII